MLKKIESSKKVQAWERVAAQAGGCLLQQENLFDDTHLKKLTILQTCSEVSGTPLFTSEKKCPGNTFFQSHSQPLRWCCAICRASSCGLRANLPWIFYTGKLEPGENMPINLSFIKIGMQAYRLGVHYWHLQRVEDAIKMLGRALKHLEITHGPEHGMYQVPNSYLVFQF